MRLRLCVCACRYHLSSGRLRCNFQHLFRLFSSSSSVVSDSIIYHTRLFSAEWRFTAQRRLVFLAGSPSRNESALHTPKSHLIDTRGGVLTLFPSPPFLPVSPSSVLTLQRLIFSPSLFLHFFIFLFFYFLGLLFCFPPSPEERRSCDGVSFILDD